MFDAHYLENGWRYRLGCMEYLWVKCPNVSSFTIKWFNVNIFKENVLHQNVYFEGQINHFIL